MKRKTFPAPERNLVGKFEIAGGKIWVRMNENDLTVWVEPRSITPTFSAEMRRWKEVVEAKHKRRQFLWIVEKKHADHALKVLFQMLGDPGERVDLQG